MQNHEHVNDKEIHSVTIPQIMMSVFASILGVQNRKSLERDFKYGKPGQFIVVSIIMVGCFIFFVYGLTQLAFAFFT